MNGATLKKPNAVYLDTDRPQNQVRRNTSMQSLEGINSHLSELKRQRTKNSAILDMDLASN